jgi:hypothetical protein
MLGFIFAGVFLAVTASFVCTEYQFVFFDAWRRVMVGADFALPLILLINVVSFLVVCGSAAVFIFTTGSSDYLAAAAICAFAQAIWLAQHLWFYHRNHLRLRYES